VHFPLAAFAWLTAEPNWYRSSRYAQRGFCAACGSTVAMREEGLSDRVQICVGSLDDDVWTSERVDWFEIKDDLPRFPRSGSAVPSKALEP